MSKSSQSNPLADYIAKLSGPDRHSGWSDFIGALGSLFEGDASLRGDLAHTLLYLGSRTRPGVGKNSFSANAYSGAICVFADQFINSTSGCTLDASFEKQSVLQFIHRENDRQKNPQSYALYVLYLIFTALQDGENKFFGHYIHNETGQITEFLSTLTTMIREKSGLGEITEFIRSFALQRQSRSQIKYDLGGMVELGQFNSEGLWQGIFYKDPPSEISTVQTSERHFLCYRFSSNDEPRINKTFLVFQSPGRLPNSSKVRKHFAFKLFYRTFGGEVRRSAGAVLQLGSTVTCFGSSEMMDEFGDASADRVRRRPHRGPKTIVFNHEKLDKPILFGLTLSMNERSVPIASRIVAIETLATHSDSVSIGTSSRQDMLDELIRHAALPNKKLTPELAAERWKALTDLLLEDARHGVLESSGHHSFNSRGLYY